MEGLEGVIDIGEKERGLMSLKKKEKSGIENLSHLKKGDLDDAFDKKQEKIERKLKRIRNGVRQGQNLTADKRGVSRESNGFQDDDSVFDSIMKKSLEKKRVVNPWDFGRREREDAGGFGKTGVKEDNFGIMKQQPKRAIQKFNPLGQ